MIFLSLWAKTKPISALKPPAQKKTDIPEHPEVFEHVGLLVNWPPGIAELPFI